MRANIPYYPFLEATVSSKGQVTLPKLLRDHLGIHTGTRLRFSLGSPGTLEVQPVSLDLDGLWKLADGGPRTAGVLSFEDMDAAKARRVW